MGTGDPPTGLQERDSGQTLDPVSVLPLNRSLTAPVLQTPGHCHSVGNAIQNSHKMQGTRDERKEGGGRVTLLLPAEDAAPPDD